MMSPTSPEESGIKLDYREQFIKVKEQINNLNS
jgi:hypothetical protein